MKETLKEAGYKYVMFLQGTHILWNLETKKFEQWYANKNHASYGLKYKNTHLEFASSMPATSTDALLSTMRRIQNFGQQHPDFRATFMNVYRKYIV